MTIKLTDQPVFITTVQDNSFKATGSDAQITFVITPADSLVYNTQGADTI